MASRYFLCIFLFFALIQSTVASEDLCKKHLNTDAPHGCTSESPENMNVDKMTGIFSRRRSLPPQKQNVARTRPEEGNARPSSVRRCARLKENCSAQSPCCSPCAFCHCRLFNTICQCWKLGVCSRKN
ncbi:agouti-signaling protein 2b [Tachysurus fulvidraco]|uniref:agouti-signaling protein 2b n=1 Tax=Tachysurus fulvidraco TaxID=1234273 RepID=UPI001FEF5790|nr:agouti-signaling protein 2b [Tachysurus fulvidraco]